MASHQGLPHHVHSSFCGCETPNTPVPFGESYVRTADHEKAVGPFLAQTYALVSSPETDNFIAWSEDGASFLVFSQKGLQTVLPNFFKHSKYTSFARQLNMYGFKKAVGKNEFYHPSFLRGCTSLLRKIVRKKASSKREPLSGPALTAEVQTLKRKRDQLEENVEVLRSQQQQSQTQLDLILKENAELRSHLEHTKTAHAQLQTTLNSIMGFLTNAYPGSEVALQMQQHKPAAPKPVPLVVDDDGPARKRRRLNEFAPAPSSSHDASVAELLAASDFAAGGGGVSMDAIAPTPESAVFIDDLLTSLDTVAAPVAPATKHVEFAPFAPPPMEDVARVPSPSAAFMAPMDVGFSNWPTLDADMTNEPKLSDVSTFLGTLVDV